MKNLSANSTPTAPTTPTNIQITNNQYINSLSIASTPNYLHLHRTTTQNQNYTAPTNKPFVVLANKHNCIVINNLQFCSSCRCCSLPNTYPMSAKKFIFSENSVFPESILKQAQECGYTYEKLTNYYNEIIRKIGKLQDCERIPLSIEYRNTQVGKLFISLVELFITEAPRSGVMFSADYSCVKRYC